MVYWPNKALGMLKYPQGGKLKVCKQQFVHVGPDKIIRPDISSEDACSKILQQF